MVLAARFRSVMPRSSSRCSSVKLLRYSSEFSSLVARIRRHAAQSPVGLRNLRPLVFGKVVVLLEQIAGVRLLLPASCARKSPSGSRICAFFSGGWLLKSRRRSSNWFCFSGGRLLKAGILFQLLLLLAGRKVAILAQPIAAMRPWALGLELVSVTAVLEGLPQEQSSWGGWLAGFRT